MELETLYDVVSSSWRFDRDNYPRLPDDETQQRLFAVNHVLKHLGEAVGAALAQTEEEDHGREAVRDVLQKSVVDAFVSALRLAPLVGLSGRELGDRAFATVRRKTIPQSA